MKWTIQMTQSELERKTIIEQAMEKRITQREGAERIGFSERHFRRILKQCREQGSKRSHGGNYEKRKPPFTYTADVKSGKDIF